MEKIFYNGVIYTLDKDNSQKEAMLIENGKIVAFGTLAEMEELSGETSEKINLEGKTVIPGLCDCHVHLATLGETKSNLDLHGKNKDEILKMVREKSKGLSPGEWILGMGWNQEDWEDSTFPTYVELDLAAPQNPVKLTRYCGHAYWCNSAAMKSAGIEKPQEAERNRGRERFTDEDGRLTGILVGESCELLDGVIPQNDDEKWEKNYLLAQQSLLGMGITSIMEKGAGVESALMTDCGRKAIEVLKRLYEQQKMKIRINETIVGTDEFFDECFCDGPQRGLYGGKLNISGIKLWADGAFGARTAYISKDYKDRPGEKGNRKFTDEELVSIFKKADEKGLQIAVHAIGDACCTQILDCYEKAFDGNMDKDRRFIIDHFHAPDTADIQRLLKNKIVLSTQFIQFATDVGMLGDIIPDKMIENLYPWREVIDGGGVICNGSDTPVDTAEPFWALYVAVMRKNLDGENTLERKPLKTLTRLEALKAYTVGAAYAGFEENVLGSLEKGKYADFIVTDKDYFKCDVEEIKDIKVLKTFINGELVYER